MVPTEKAHDQGQSKKSDTQVLSQPMAAPTSSSAATMQMPTYNSQPPTASNGQPFLGPAFAPWGSMPPSMSMPPPHLLMQQAAAQAALFQWMHASGYGGLPPPVFSPGPPLPGAAPGSFPVTWQFGQGVQGGPPPPWAFMPQTPGAPPPAPQQPSAQAPPQEQSMLQQSNSQAHFQQQGLPQQPDAQAHFQQQACSSDSTAAPLPLPPLPLPPAPFEEPAAAPDPVRASAPALERATAGHPGDDRQGPLHQVAARKPRRKGAVGATEQAQAPEPGASLAAPLAASGRSLLAALLPGGAAAGGKPTTGNGARGRVGAEGPGEQAQQPEKGASAARASSSAPLLCGSLVVGAGTAEGGDQGFWDVAGTRALLDPDGAALPWRGGAGGGEPPCALQKRKNGGMRAVPVPAPAPRRPLVELAAAAPASRPPGSWVAPARAPPGPPVCCTLP